MQQKVEGTLRLAFADLSRFAALSGQKDLAGTARLDAKIRRDGADRPLTVALDGQEARRLPLAGLQQQTRPSTPSHTIGSTTK